MDHILEASERQHDWEEAASSKVAVVADNKPIRKIICRYGRGCTHIYDPIHKDRFWHPPCPHLNVQQIRTNYICNECGTAFTVLRELQRHLQRKTAWSNNSLIGSRVSCLVDNKEWHEGIVCQYHPKSGKHYVEFRAIGEKRWFNMIKMAFYIIERPQESSVEVKEMDVGDNEEQAPAPTTEEIWTYVEDISLDYAFAQSVLFKIYGSVIQETGHKTRGHICLTADDRDVAKNSKGSLLYGELLPRGANRALDDGHLHAQDAVTLFDLGCGTGKIAIQAFLQYRNLLYVYGVELSVGRYNVAEEAVLHMVELLGEDMFLVEVTHGSSITIREKPYDGEENYRILKIECGNMMDVNDIHKADVVMLETDIPQDLQSQLCALLQNMSEGARTLTYLDLRKIWDYGQFPFKQLESNRLLTDRFPTSWSVQRGHHFFIWNKILKPQSICSSNKGSWVNGGGSNSGCSNTIHNSISSNQHTYENTNHNNNNNNSHNNNEDLYNNNNSILKARGGPGTSTSVMAVTPEGRKGCLPYLFSSSPSQWRARSNNRGGGGVDSRNGVNSSLVLTSISREIVTANINNNNQYHNPNDNTNVTNSTSTTSVTNTNTNMQIISTTRQQQQQYRSDIDNDNNTIDNTTTRNTNSNITTTSITKLGGVSSSVSAVIGSGIGILKSRSSSSSNSAILYKTSDDVQGTATVGTLLGGGGGMFGSTPPGSPPTTPVGRKVSPRTVSVIPKSPSPSSTATTTTTTTITTATAIIGIGAGAAAGVGNMNGSIGHGTGSVNGIYNSNGNGNGITTITTVAASVAGGSDICSESPEREWGRERLKEVKVYKEPGARRVMTMPAKDRSIRGLLNNNNNSSNSNNKGGADQKLNNRSDCSKKLESSTGEVSKSSCLIS
eukprot:gene7804-15968_t